MSKASESHAFVVPDQDFENWLNVLREYTQIFPRVAVVRSPRGNDLNRYRNVTAVAAPLTWLQDDPVTHIRRIYPMVVRVDVIPATTPEALREELAQRIANRDRYGEESNADDHLDERFVLAWPTDHQPMRITQPFGTATLAVPGVGIASRLGAKVRCAAAGRVSRQWQSDQPDALNGLTNYIQVTSEHEGATYLTTYVGLRRLSVPTGTPVSVGDVLGEAIGEAFALMLQHFGAGEPLGHFAHVIDPTRHFYVEDLRVRPTDVNLRVRSLPSIQGQILTQVNPSDELEIAELHGRVLAKVGVPEQWVRVRLPDGRIGFAAGWFLRAAVEGQANIVFPGVNIVGVNLDQLHPLGTPDPSQLGDIGWVRFGYNVSNNSGSTDLQAAYDRYAPLAERYVKAGYHLIFTTSHQTYGEGRDEYWPWTSMDDPKWAHLIPRFAEMMEKIAEQWAGTGLVHAWQVWNEQDAPKEAVASVPMRPHNYAHMLRESILAIRAHDSAVQILTGGHTGGPGIGAQFARDTLRQLPAGIRPDGIAFHPYGRGVDELYAPFGHIDESIREYGKLVPDKPLWITEWGILDRPNDDPAQVARYALNMIKHLQSRYPGKVAALVWYAWAESMHNGYGIVDEQGQPRPPLTEQFLQA